MEILLRNLVAPIAKRTFCELHDVPLVHQRYAFALVLDRISDRAVDQAHAARATDRFDADSYANIVAFRCADFFPELGCFFFRAKANFIELFWKLLLEKIQYLL